ITTWIELAVSIAATPLVLLLIYTLLTSVLHRGCKTFLIMNGLGLLFLTTSHVSVAVFRLTFPGEWKAQDIVSNIPLFLHQLAYSTCNVSMLLITIERTIIGVKPNLRAFRGFISNIKMDKATILQIFIALPCVMLVQDGPFINGKKLYNATEISQKIALLIFTIFDTTAVLSSRRYNQTFHNSTLGTRYQVQEVISLTRILIPICCSSLIFRFTVIILAYIAFGNEKVLDLFFTIIRFCCTTAAIIEPALLLSRHRLLQKRLRLLLGWPMLDVLQPELRDSAAVADVYFDAFKKDMH
ncbi:hypothetical protein PENTCL1PPCAC_15986, partial [Pristionchus entomophagus]